MVGNATDQEVQPDRVVRRPVHQLLMRVVELIVCLYGLTSLDEVVHTTRKLEKNCHGFYAEHARGWQKRKTDV